MTLKSRFMQEMLARWGTPPVANEPSDPEEIKPDSDKSDIDKILGDEVPDLTNNPEAEKKS